MKYLIVTEDTKALETVIEVFNNNNLKVVCNKKNNEYIYDIDDILDVDAVVVNVDDIEKIANAFPLKCFRIVTITTEQFPENLFEKAVADKKITMPIGMNCGVVHRYNPAISKTTINHFTEFLIGSMKEHDNINHIVQYCVKNNFLKRGQFENTVTIVNNADKQERSLSTEVFSEIVLSNPNTFKGIVSNYLKNNKLG